MRYAILLIALWSGWATAHSLSPPIQKRVFVNGQTIVRFDAYNKLPETRSFTVELYTDVKEFIKLPSEYWDAIPTGYTQGTGEQRTIAVRVKDDGFIKKAFVCTTTKDEGYGEMVIGVVTRVCSLVKLYRPGDLTKPEPTQRASR